MEVQDSSVINVVMKVHKRQIRTAHGSRTWNMEHGVIMQFQMKVHFTADHEGKFLNKSYPPVNVIGHLPDKIDQSGPRNLLAKVQIDPSHRFQISEIEIRSQAKSVFNST